MEVSEGFIVGVFNYCDRWCERCPLTSRCRVFADTAEDAFEHDHGAIGEPRHERMGREIGAAMERWEKTLGIDFDEIQREAEEALKNMADPEELFDVPLEHLELEARAHDFGQAVWRWLKAIPDEQFKQSHPLQVLAHFWLFVGGKVHRALIGLKDGEELGERSDARGSAKIAMLALEEMRVACVSLTTTGVMTTELSDSFVESIDWLVTRIGATLPDARLFVRAGFDEPDELARLRAEESVGG